MQSTVSLVLAALATGASAASRIRRGPAETSAADVVLKADLAKDVSPAITQAPQLFGRMGNVFERAVGVDRTCGYYNQDVSSAVRCDVGYTCTTSSTILDCCSGSGCSTSRFDTACLDYAACSNIPIGSHSGTYCCTFSTERPYCSTFLWSSADSGDKKTFFNCGRYSTSRQSILFNTFIADVPGFTFSSSSDSFPTSRSVSRSGDVTVTATPSSSSSSGGDGGGGGSDSKGAIIGGVVGGIAALGIIGLGAFFLLRRRGSKDVATPPPAGAPQAYQQPPMQQYGSPPPPSGSPAYGQPGFAPGYGPAAGAAVGGAAAMHQHQQHTGNTLPPVQQQYTGPQQYDPRYSVVSQGTGPAGYPHQGAPLGTPQPSPMGMQTTGGSYQNPSPGIEGFGNAPPPQNQGFQPPPNYGQPQGGQVWEAPTNHPSGTGNNRAELS